jgi:DegT/DnrJ/EryC1/StrS aminotransferase family protein
MSAGTSHETKIEGILRERTGRECIYVPSGRLGIYIALVTWLSPGDRILMSPLDDDVVLFTVLAAGLRPVMAPLSPVDGNIDPDAVPDRTWAAVRGVLTTNLYGLPDRMTELRDRCDRLGLVLVEDAAHALHIEVGGRPIGSFGAAAVFSLSKRVGGVGGVVALADENRRDEVVRLRDGLVSDRPLRVRISDALRPRVLPPLDRIGLRAPLRFARRSLTRGERRANRMPLRPTRLRSAIAAAPAIDPFDSWMRVDKHDYRLAQRVEAVARTVERLRSPADDRAARIEGTRKLRQLAATAPAAQAGDPQALLRVPLLVEDRAVAGASLEAAGHPLHYVFDPPLDDYAGEEFVDSSQAPEAARWWARHALPVDPLLADAALAALSDVAEAVRPASAPSRARRGAAARP